MQNPLNNWDKVYTITYQVDSYLTFQCEVFPIVGYMKDTCALWNEKVKIYVSGQISWSVKTLHLQIIYS